MYLYRYAVETTDIAKLLIVGTAVRKEAELAVYRRVLRCGGGTAVSTMA